MLWRFGRDVLDVCDFWDLGLCTGENALFLLLLVESREERLLSV